MRTLVKVINGHGGFNIAIPDDFAAVGEDGQSEIEELHVEISWRLYCEMGILLREGMKVFMHRWQVEGDCRKYMVVIHETATELMAQYV